MPLQLPNGLNIAAGYLDLQRQKAILRDIRKVVEAAPLYTPVMPRWGRPFSVRMSAAGPLGWVSDKSGYRYQPVHPVTGKPWPDIPSSILEIWKDLSGYKGSPECCLINFYSPEAKMGLHRDEDEKEFAAPIVSISLGDSCLFRIGGSERKDSTQSFKLHSGDVIVMGGEARLGYHGVDRIYPDTSALLKNGGRINLTLRRVTIPD